jgi:hypothetical protein
VLKSSVFANLLLGNAWTVFTRRDSGNFKIGMKIVSLEHKITTDMRGILKIVVLVLLLTACSNKVSSPKYPNIKWEKYRGTEESIKKYLDENADELDPIEGIYSISATDERKVKYLFGLWSEQKKIGESNDFARVAIIRDNISFNAQFMEIIVGGEYLPKYAKTADFTRVQKSSTYLSRRFLPDGKVENYSFEEKHGTLVGYNKKGDLTSRLYYLKLYPVKE